MKIIIENVEIDRKYIKENITNFVKFVKNSIKDLLNDLLTLRTNRNKKRNEKENLFSARFNDFFSNFVYRNESTENYSFNFLKENNINIDNAILISSLIAETIEEKKKNID